MTELNSNAFCVAGWCAAAGQMVRPLPDGDFWSSTLLQQHRVEPGVTINVARTGLPRKTSYPHQTEDTTIVATSISRAAVTPTAWFGPGAPPFSETIADAFGGQVEANRKFEGTVLGAYVRKDSRTRSLWAVRVDRSTVEFSEPKPGKLRVAVCDRDTRYNLPVSSVRIKAVWRDGGLKALERSLPAWGFLHLRVGLARAFGMPPDQCYIMANDLHW